MKKTKSALIHGLAFASLSIAWVGCVPEPTGPSEIEGSVPKIGCNSLPNLTMSCVSDSNEALGNFNLSLDVNCLSDGSVSSISVTSNDLRSSDTECAITDRKFEISSKILKSIIAPGGVFELDTTLHNIKPSESLEWKCAEIYGSSANTDRSDFYHFLRFERIGSTIHGTMENRNVYTTPEGEKQSGASKCIFQFEAPAVPTPTP